MKKSACRLRNIAMRDYQKSVTTGQTDMPDKQIPLCRYASQATQKTQKAQKKSKQEPQGALIAHLSTMSS